MYGFIKRTKVIVTLVVDIVKLTLVLNNSDSLHVINTLKNGITVHL